MDLTFKKGIFLMFYLAWLIAACLTSLETCLKMTLHIINFSLYQILVMVIILTIGALGTERAIMNVISRD